MLPTRGWFRRSPSLERSVRPCGPTATRNYTTPLTPPLQHPILMRILPTTMLTLKTFSQLTTSYSTALSRRSFDLNERTKQDGSAAHAAPIDASLQSASIGSIPYAISPTHQFPLPYSLILTFVHHKLYSKIPRRSCACQNGPGPGRVNSLISNEVWRSIEFSR